MNLSGSETTRIEPLEILRFFYPEDTPLRRLLLKHSTQVREKALSLLEHSPLRGEVDPALVAAGAMLHDIGIVHCHAPKILCTGSEPYLAHGPILPREKQLTHLSKPLPIIVLHRRGV